MVSPLSKRPKQVSRLGGTLSSSRAVIPRCRASPSIRQEKHKFVGQWSMTEISRQARCKQSCEDCARECELALEQDPDYTQPGTEPYSERHLALVACVATCTLTAAALREGKADAELVLWCAETCRNCTSTVEMSSSAWSRLLDACLACSVACEAFAGALSHQMEIAQ